MRTRPRGGRWGVATALTRGFPGESIDGLGAHGLLSGGQLHSPAASLNPAEPFPALAWVVRSLAPGQEYFGFCLSLQMFSTRQAVVLLIAKDVTSGLWHLHNTTMSGAQGMVAWNLAASSRSALLLPIGEI